MGLSSSQARLLSLTARMHDIEYKAAKLEAQKLQMANESRRVYEDYLNAIDLTKIQLATLDHDGSINYIDAAYSNMIAAGYEISPNSDYLLISQADIDEFYSPTFNGNVERYAAIKSGLATQNESGDYVLATNNDKYLVFNESEFSEYALSNKDIILMKDISLDTSSGYIAENYSGTLDGNGNTLNITGKDGLFRYLKDGAVVSNLNLNVNIDNPNDKLVKAALSRAVEGNVNINNINISGTISSWYTAGGLIGTCRGDLNISNISFNNFKMINTDDQDSTTSATFAGIASNNLGVLNISGVTGTISIDGGYSASGVLGRVYRAQGLNPDKNSITNIQNVNINVDINSEISDNAGGIISIAMSPDTVIKNCYVSGNITVSNYEDEENARSSTASGIVGGIRGGLIENCYSDTVLNGEIYAPIKGRTYYQTDVEGDDTAVYPLCLKNIGGSDNDGNVITDNSKLYYESSLIDLELIQTLSPEEIKSISQTHNGLRLASESDNTNNDSFISSPEYEYYKSIGEKIISNKYFITDNYAEDSQWFSNLVENGYVLLSKKDSKGIRYDISVATDTALQEVTDKTLLRKAEAKYEADMKRIDMKDRKFDTDLAALDNERNAIKQEIDTLKTVAKDNVERTFRLFS